MAMSKAAREAQIVDELSGLVTDDELLAILDVAEKEGDSLSYLRGKLESISQRADRVEAEESASDSLEASGLRIEPNIVLRRNKKQEIEEVIDGYRIVKIDEATGKMFFAGRSLTWTPAKYVAVPFATEALATAAAITHLKLTRQSAETHSFALSEVSVTLPLAPKSACRSTPGQIHFRLTLDEAVTLDQLYWALRKQNAVVETSGRSMPSKPVSSRVDAMRWLLRATHNAIAERRL